MTIDKLNPLKSDYLRKLTDHPGLRSVRIALADAVVRVAAILTVVGSVSGVPHLRIEGAVRALSDVVLAQDVRIEESLQ